MNPAHLQKHFRRMGAELKVSYQDVRRGPWGWQGPERFSIDTATRKGKEYFVLNVNKDRVADLSLEVVDVNASLRHLLLLSRREDDRGRIQKEKFLCGHDERHWFVCEVGSSRPVTNVWSALEALKPSMVISSQFRHKVKRKNWQKRNNDGYFRQGEWFFIPAPHFSPSNTLSKLKNEPLRRNWRSKAHILEEAYREGGRTVYVSYKYPTGLTEGAYQNLLKNKPELSKLNWRIMRRDPRLYARGRVRHGDHATLYLPTWHMVVMNTEGLWNPSIAFLD